MLGQADLDSGEANRGGAGPAADSLRAPLGVARDPVSGKIFVADSGNVRVLRYASEFALASGVPAEAVFGQSDFVSNSASASRTTFFQPAAIALDAAGNLWVADLHRIVMFADAANRTSGAEADGLLAAPDFDDLAAGGNGRILYFASPGGKGEGAPADGVLGQLGLDTFQSPSLGQSRFWGPRGIAVDSLGTLWVSEEFNHRVTRFDGAAASALANAADAGQNLAPADGVLGQADFDSFAQSASPAGAISPWAVAASPYGPLWVAMRGNTVNGGNRVVRYRPEADSYQADSLAGTRRNALRGTNRINSSGGGQTVSYTVRRTRGYRLYGGARNAGVYLDDLRFSAPAVKRDFRVVYFDLGPPRANVTGRVTKGGLVSAGIAPGAVRAFEVSVTPRRSLAGRRRTLMLRLASVSALDASRDVARLRVVSRIP